MYYLPVKDILLIDDDTTITNMLSVIFTKKNISFDIFNSGSEFISSYKQYPKYYTLIIVDYHMEGINGTNIVKFLRKEYHYSNLIVGHTGFQDNESLISFKDAGLNELFIKPIKMKTIMNYMKYQPYKYHIKQVYDNIILLDNYFYTITHLDIKYLNYISENIYQLITISESDGLNKYTTYSYN